MRKIKKPRCFRCDKQINFLYEVDSDYIKKQAIRYRRQKSIKDLYNEENIRDGVMIVIEPSYGSMYDEDEIVIGICDQCIMENLNSNNSFYIE